VLTGVAAAAEPVRQDLDRPAFLRRMNDIREPRERVAVPADDEWDVPTFLRKQSDSL
jgi:cell division protein FtsZ